MCWPSRFRFAKSSQAEAALYRCGAFGAPYVGGEIDMHRLIAIILSLAAITRLTFPLLLLPLIPAIGAEKKTVYLEPVVVSEARTRVAFLTAAEPDCSPQQLVVRVTKQPANGKLEVEEGNGFGYSQKENIHAKCGERPIWGMLVYYTSNANFKGSDTAVVESSTEAGVASRYRFKITVK
jgi:hypothetical protein